MRELLARLTELQQQWYANEIDSDAFAYEVFAIRDSLEAYAGYEDHVKDCPMTT